MSRITAGPWLLVSALCTLSAAQAARVTVTIEGIRSTDGAIRVGLFGDAAGFPYQPARGEAAAARIPSVTVVFDEVEPGRYAVSAFHDRNGNGKLDRGAFGYPREPFGFSRDARPMTAPPRFEDAAFDVPAEGIALTIHLK